MSNSLAFSIEQGSSLGQASRLEALTPSRGGGIYAPSTVPARALAGLKGQRCSCVE
jgi:hypothetical protein